MEAPDTFTFVPITVDPQTKAVKLDETNTPSTPSSSLAAELATLNALHRSFLTLDTPNSIPPPPVPVKPQRSAQVTKLKDSGNVSFRKGAYADAVKLYSLAIEMALGRPLWEPQGLVREEVSALYANRAQAYMATREWGDGLVDAEASLEAKRVGNPKAWYRKAKCLLEMGRLDEANEVARLGVDCEGESQAGDLRMLGREVQTLMEKRER